jgi:prevent-host-death family protein
MTSWAVTKAKAQFSAVLDKAESEGPQIVERGERGFVVLTEEELARRTVQAQAPIEGQTAGRTSGQDLWDALRPAPEDRVDFEVPRLMWQPREVKF